MHFTPGQVQQLQDLGCAKKQVALLEAASARIAVSAAVKRGDLNARLKRIAVAADKLAAELSQEDLVGAVAALFLPVGLVPAHALEDLAMVVRRHIRRQRSDPQWIDWIDDALRAGQPAGESRPRGWGHTSNAFVEVVEVCAAAAGVKFLKHALERYPAWRKQQMRRRAMVAALRNTPTLGAK